MKLYIVLADEISIFSRGILSSATGMDSNCNLWFQISLMLTAFDMPWAYVDICLGALWVVKLFVSCLLF